MPEVPKIVHQRLRASASEAPTDHPGADVLTAFAEHSLLAAEREGVLAHLSVCDECRELLAVRSPDLEFVPVTANSEELKEISEVRKPATRRAWFAWNRLAWACLAAGIAIAAAVLATHPGKTPSTEALKKGSPPMVPAAVQPPASSTFADAKAGAPQRSLDYQANDVQAKAAKTINRPVKPEVSTRRDGAKKLAAPPVPEVKEEVAVVNELQASAGDLAADKDARTEQKVASPGAANRPTAGANETVEVTAETDAMTTRESSPVTRAKAARTATAPAMAQAASANEKQIASKQESTDAAVGGSLSQPGNMARASRRVGESGALVSSAAQWTTLGNKLQESLDSGAHWKTVFYSVRKLFSVSQAGNDVWAGGEKGDLFHSGDAGTTWAQIQASINGQALADDVTHINVHDALHVVLFTAKNEAWSTTDGGVTWQKK